MRAIPTIPASLIALASSTASAVTQPPQIGPLTPYVERGLLWGRAQGGVSVGVTGDTGPEGSIDTTLALSAGLTDRVTLDGSFGTVTLAPSVRYNSPGLGVTVGMIDQKRFELDAAARVTFGIGDSPLVSRIEPGAQAIVRLGRAARLDLGTYLPISPGKAGGATTIGARAPLSVGFQLGPYFHTVIGSGVTIENVAHAGKTIVVPLSLGVGISAKLRNGSGIGLSPSISWPRFLDTGRAEPAIQAMPVLGATFFVSTP